MKRILMIMVSIVVVGIVFCKFKADKLLDEMLESGIYDHHLNTKHFLLQPQTNDSNKLIVDYFNNYTETKNRLKKEYETEREIRILKNQDEERRKEISRLRNSRRTETRVIGIKDDDYTPGWNQPY